MPLVLVPIVPILLGLFLYASLKAFDMTERPKLDATAGRKPSFLRQTAFGRAVLAVKWVAHVTHIQKAITSRFAIAHFPVMTRWFHGHTQRVNAQAREIGAISNDTADALTTLRRKTMPRAINAKVAPVRSQAAAAQRTARRSISLTRREAKERQRSISGVNRKLGPIAALLLGADLFVFGRHARTHHRHHTRDIPRIRDRDIPRLKARDKAQATEQARTKSRLKRIERALGLGIVAGIVYRTLTRVAPWLFCRNVKKLGNLACGVNPSTMNALTALLLGTMAVGNLEQLARFAVSVEEEVARDVKDLLGA